MRKKFYLFIVLLFVFSNMIYADKLYLEAESFNDNGGWVVDQQFMDIMGSPYLMAHGMGEKVSDANTIVDFPSIGLYHVFIRTFNWTSPWFSGKGPGGFRLKVADKRLSVVGNIGEKWEWQYAGKVKINYIRTKLSLEDILGFNGRCDAIYFTKDENDVPPEDVQELKAFKEKVQPNNSESAKYNFDFVVVGGGIAGICAAVSAARLGCKVALINDRPVLGGNNSSEVRVHLGGRIEVGPYKNLGNLIKEFGPTRFGNAKPAFYYEDEKKDSIINNEKNITMFANIRVVEVKMQSNHIVSVIGEHIRTGVKTEFYAPLFSDCTGDGTVGYLAGAHYAMGRESYNEYFEESAPEFPDSLTMGASVQWYSQLSNKSTKFPLFKYGINFNNENCEKVTMGEWTWETGMNYNQINDFERIRDYGLMVVFSNWSFLKNELKDNDKYLKRKLGWVAYISGKRESRRLLGDYILKESDLRKSVIHEDATASTTWSIDLHYPDPANSKNFPNTEFKSIAKHIAIHYYPVPYRCLYSRNIENLFMAGRNISVTHVALGTTRVMRTTGMLGEVVGMAAYLCKKNNVLPRGIYWKYLDELKTLMKDGIGKKNLKNNQKYNEGKTLGESSVK